MFCPSCGNQESDTARFCSTCGKTLPATSQAATASPSGILPGNSGSFLEPHPPGRRPVGERSPALVVLFSLLTCGIYMVFWYFSVLGELEDAGRNPTGNNRWLDFLLVLITCGLWGLFVDYKISKTIVELQELRGVVRPNDTSVLVLVLDIVGLGLLGSAFHQSEMNRLWLTGRW